MSEITENTVCYGTARCGHQGQIFRTGLCAHCHIAHLEALLATAINGLAGLEHTLGIPPERRD